jgi:aspartyl-tRNA(Asn)/glutamyl-tRNA(Gln) amidotransferase subunit B
MAAVPVTPAALAELVGLIDTNVISSTVAKDVFDRMWVSGGTARAIVDAEGLAQIGDETALAKVIEGVIAGNPDAIAQVRAGKNNAFGFLVGQVMKATGGKANPKVVSQLLRAAIS